MFQLKLFVRIKMFFEKIQKLKKETSKSDP
jgi:hypothetical protein